MLGGIVLIIAGVLSAVSPPLLSFIVAALLIALGMLAVLVGDYNKKLQRRYDNPVIELFFRL
jgi:hypothetical protein